MPRRKISIEEAFSVLEQAGIQVQVKSVVDDTPVPTEQPVKLHMGPYGQTDFNNVDAAAAIANRKYAKVTLYARHTVGSGGSMVATLDGKVIEGSGVEAYGPGVCTVPTALLSQLLYADAVARQADDNMLSRELKSKLIVQRVDSSGNRCDIGIDVPPELLDITGLATLPMAYTYRISGR